MESEFSTRDDGWPGLKKEYGLSPDAKVSMLDTGDIYTATQKGQDCNFGEVFETDGRISALKLQVMEDDKHFFPIYQGALTIKADLLAKYPAIADVIAQISPKLTTEVMQQLNAKADVDGEDPGGHRQGMARIGRPDLTHDHPNPRLTLCTRPRRS